MFVVFPLRLSAPLLSRPTLLRSSGKDVPRPGVAMPCTTLTNDLCLSHL